MAEVHRRGVHRLVGRPFRWPISVQEHPARRASSTNWQNRTLDWVQGSLRPLLPGLRPRARRGGQPGRRNRRVPPPRTLARLDLDLPGRKSEYLRAVAEAALDGLLDGAALRALDPCQGDAACEAAVPR
jgi:hypothetical protein